MVATYPVQNQQQREMATPEQLARMLTVPEPFVPKPKKPYDGPTGPFIFEFRDMGDPVKKADEYQNERKDRYEAWFDFEIVLDAAGNPTGWGPGVNPETGEMETGEIIRQYFTISLHEKSTLRPVVEALQGGRLSPRQQVSKEALQGLRMMATITVRESETAKVEVPVLDASGNETGRTQNVPMSYPKLSGFLPWNPAAAAAPQGRRQPVANPVGVVVDSRAGEEPGDVPF